MSVINRQSNTLCFRMAHNIESIDLDQMIRNWALREFDKTATWRQKRLHQKEKGNENNYMGVHIDYSQVKFRDETKWPKLADTTDGATGDGKHVRSPCHGDS